MQLIRIEHINTKNGPFNSKCDNGVKHLKQSIFYDRILERHRDMDIFPSYWCDSELQRNFKEGGYNSDYIPNFRFAFTSITEFEFGFNKEEILDLIKLCGFRVYLIEASIVFRSGYQAMFKLDSVIKKEDISSIFL
jgi:hypothetical protein